MLRSLGNRELLVGAGNAQSRGLYCVGTAFLWWDELICYLPGRPASVRSWNNVEPSAVQQTVGHMDMEKGRSGTCHCRNPNKTPQSLTNPLTHRGLMEVSSCELYTNEQGKTSTEQKGVRGILPLPLYFSTTTASSRHTEGNMFGIALLGQSWGSWRRQNRNGHNAWSPLARKQSRTDRRIPVINTFGARVQRLWPFGELLAHAKLWLATMAETTVSQRTVSQQHLLLIFGCDVADFFRALPLRKRAWNLKYTVYCLYQNEQDKISNSVPRQPNVFPQSVCLTCTGWQTN